LPRRHGAGGGARVGCRGGAAGGGRARGGWPTAAARHGYGGRGRWWGGEWRGRVVDLSRRPGDGGAERRARGARAGPGGMAKVFGRHGWRRCLMAGSVGGLGCRRAAPCRGSLYQCTARVPCRPCRMRPLFFVQRICVSSFCSSRLLPWCPRTGRTWCFFSAEHRAGPRDARSLAATSSANNAPRRTPPPPTTVAVTRFDRAGRKVAPCSACTRRPTVACMQRRHLAAYPSVTSS